MQILGKGVKKIDSKAIVTGKPIYTDDLASDDALIVKVLRSPHAFATIKDIDVSKAKVSEGVACVLTYEDVPKTRYTLAGQSYPEPSVYDELILDQVVRFQGDSVAIVAADTEDHAIAAMKKIKVTYDVHEPVLDFEKAEESKQMIHEDRFSHLPQFVSNWNPQKNIVCTREENFGDDFESVYQACDVKIDRTYYTQAQAQSMMETFRSYTYLDAWGRLIVVSSTQVPFHIKRQLARALQMPTSKIRVIKPRVGGGFGAKQSSETEVYAAIVTLKTGKPAKIVYTRKETYSGSNSRHAMRVRVRMGSTKDGVIEACHVDALSDQGAYGRHAFTTVNLVGEKSMPVYNKLKAAKFTAKVVYTNKLPGGAFRGYGATQGCFSVESTVNELADILKMDPVELRLKNIVKEGEKTLAFNKNILSCGLDECIQRGAEKIGWSKDRVRVLENGMIRSKAMAITMQGSGIANIDTATAQVKLNEGGDLTLLMSATDIGTGTDTILTQMVAELMNVSMEDVTTIAADTDITPYDPGSYASSGAYVTGKAVELACYDLQEQILLKAAEMLDVSVEQLSLGNAEILCEDGRSLSYEAIGEKATAGISGGTLIGTGRHGTPVSPPPYMAGFCEVEVDPETGLTKVVDYVGVVDCGTVMNENLARVQVEGGIAQGIGLGLYEDVHYGATGRQYTNSFMSYKIPSRVEIPKMDISFVTTYEPSGPFGAKSIGEVVINTPAPAIQAAVAQVSGKYFSRLPIKAEDVFWALKNK